MPTLTAATKSRSGAVESVPASTSFSMARPRATKAPVMDAVRVPPSAWMTSQSRVMVRSPNRLRSTTARRARPIRRWISWVRPLWRPRAASRGVRVRVERGSMLYSAVIQPLPAPLRKAGTVSSIEAVQITRVLPTSISAEPSAVEMKSGTMLTGRSWSGSRLSMRKTMSLFFNVDQLDVVNRMAQKRSSEPAEFFHRVGSIAAQSAGSTLAAVVSQKLGDLRGGGFRRIDYLHLGLDHAAQQRPD